MSAVSPGVFISHKLDDPATDQFLAQIRPQLEALNCQIWIDTQIAPGEVWRHELSTWMSVCTCAMLLISKAALQSDWIFQEASILSWRQEQDKKFKLFPVVLDRLSDDQIANSRLKVVLDILRLQSPGRNADDATKIQSTVQAIRSHLEREHDDENEFSKTARKIAGLLKNLDDSSLKNAADILQIDLGQWVPGWDPKFVFALEILTAGPAELINTLEELEVEANVKGKIGAYALPFWVDVRAAEVVRRIAQASENRPLMLLNIGFPETAEDYVRRAAFSPTRSWRAHHASNVFGEDFEGDFWDEVCTCIWRDSGRDESVLARPAELRRRVEQFLKITARSAPQFVTINVAEGPDWPNLEALRRDHASVIYFLISGAKLPDPAEYAVAAIEVVKPELIADFEGKIDGLRTYIASLS